MSILVITTGVVSVLFFMAGCLQVALYVGSIGEQTFAMYWPGLVASAWPVGVAALLFILLDIRLNMPEEIEDETYDSIPEAPSHRKARVVEGSEEGLHMAPEDESRIMPPSTPPTDMKATMKMAQPPTALVEMQATMKMAQPAPAPVSPPAPPAPPTPPTPPLAAPYPPEQPQENPYPQEQATRPVTSPGAPNHPDSSDSLSYFKL